MSLKPGGKAWMELNNVDVSAYITNLDINLKGKTLIDVTTMGATGRKWGSDELQDVVITIDFLFDDTVTSGSWAVLEALFDKTTPSQFDIRPNGTGTYPEISGDGWIEALPVSMPIGEMIRISGVVLKPHNACTINPTAP